jgi:hypothetical protein
VEVALSTGDGDGSKLNQHREVDVVIYSEVLKVITARPGVDHIH